MAKKNRFAKSLGDPKDAEKQKAIKALTGSAPATEEEETVPFNCNLPKTMHEDFKTKCKQEGRTMTWVIERAIRDYLKET